MIRPRRHHLTGYSSNLAQALNMLKLSRVRFYSRRRYFVEIPDRYNANNSNEQMLNSVIAWSFYPKLLTRDGKGWRNIANNQAVSLHSTSVNKGVGNSLKWLSYYHIMQSSNKYVTPIPQVSTPPLTTNPRFYNAHETSSVEDFAVALACGDAEFKVSPRQKKPHPPINLSPTHPPKN